MDESRISVDEALKRILSRIQPLPDRDVSIMDALGSSITEEIRTDADIPQFSYSAMDGYAVRSADVAHPPTKLRVVGSVVAGCVPDRAVGRGEAIRIMTGAPLPAGADTVVGIEDTDNASDVVAILTTRPKGASIRIAGEEARRSDILLPRGAVATPACIGLLASIGRQTVRVTARPRVAIISTGSELVDVNVAPPPGKSRAGNAYALAAAVLAARATAWWLGIVPDDAGRIRAALDSAADADAILVTGGTSRGDYDLVGPSIEALGTVHVWSIASRPGRIMFGEIERRGRAIPIFALPGNPVGALLTFEVFTRPALLKLAGAPQIMRARVGARTVNAIEKPSGMRLLTAGVYDARSGTVETRDRRTHHMLSSLALTNCLVDVPEIVTQVLVGDVVQVIRLDLPDTLDSAN